MVTTILGTYETAEHDHSCKTSARMSKPYADLVKKCIPVSGSISARALQGVVDQTRQVLRDEGVSPSKIPCSPAEQSTKQKLIRYKNIIQQFKPLDLLGVKGRLDTAQLERCARMQNPPADPHETFVAGYSVDFEKFFFVVTVSTPCILQREISRADMIAVDGTFKLVMGGFPVVVTCEVRENGLSKVRSISLVSGETEECVGEALKHSLKLSGKSNIKFDMHDAGSAVFAAAKSTLPESRHLMCWFHMRPACKKQVRVLLRGDAEKKTDRAHASSQERAALVQEMLSHIDFLHCCQSDADFTRLGELMEQNWRARGEGECMDYLHKEWLTGDCQFWYVGASRWLPSSDNHLEAHNRVLKVRLAGNPSPIPILLRNMRPYLGEVSRSLDRSSKDFDEAFADPEPAVSNQAWVASHRVLLKMSVTDIPTRNAVLMVDKTVVLSRDQTIELANKFFDCTWESLDVAEKSHRVSRLVQLDLRKNKYYCTCSFFAKDRFVFRYHIFIYLSVIFVYRFCAHSVRVEVIKGLRRERFIKKGVEALPVGLTVVQERERITTSDLCLKPIGEPEIMTMTGISYIKL